MLFIDCVVAVFGFFISTGSLFAAPKKVVVGHPACLSGKYAKAGEQAVGGIKACVDWINNSYGGVMGSSHWEYGVKYSKEEAKKSKMDWIGPGQDEFVALFKKAVGKDIIPDYHAAEAGAQVLAYVMAVEKTNSINTDKVRAALGDLQFMSFYGGWDVDDTGMQIGHIMVDVQWQNKDRVIVWPRKLKQASCITLCLCFLKKQKER